MGEARNVATPYATASGNEESTGAVRRTERRAQPRAPAQSPAQSPPRSPSPFGEPAAHKGPWLTWAVAGLVLAVGIGTAIVLAQRRSEDEAVTEATGTTQPDAVGSTPSTTAGSTGKPGEGPAASEVVQVVDKGWTVNAETATGSYAVEIENTGDEALGAFLLRIKAYDDADQAISGADDWKVVISAMQPGQRIGIADDLDTPDMADNGISRLEVVVAEVSSDPMSGVREPTRVPDGEVVVTKVNTWHDQAGTKVTYEVRSTYPAVLDADAYVVFRDADGKIVGGASSFLDLPAGGTAKGDFDIREGVLPDTVATADVYVVPELTR